MIQYKQFDYDDEDDDQNSTNSMKNGSQSKINFDPTRTAMCLTDSNLRISPLTISSSVNTILNNKNPSLTIKTDSVNLSDD